MQRDVFAVLMLLAFIVFTIGENGVQYRCNVKEHEVPTNCYTTCGGTCDSQGKIIHCPNQDVAICKPGCTCVEGYTRKDHSSNSPCIPISSCPSNNTVKCKLHEVYSDCWNTCVEACNRRGPIFCPEEHCGIEGCFCAEGYIRLDWRNSKSPCIPPSRCRCTK